MCSYIHPCAIKILDASADEIVSLAGDSATAAERLGEAASDVDVVIDYLWGKPTELAMVSILTKRTDKARLLSWVQIGSVAGPNAVVPSAALRSANLHLLGSGQGSVSTTGYLAEFPALIDAITAGKLLVNPLPVPLSKVEEVWHASSDGGERVVFVPSV